MIDRDPNLTDADRSGIEAIRRQLDAEFGALEETPRLHLTDDSNDHTDDSNDVTDDSSDLTDDSRDLTDENDGDDGRYLVEDPPREWSSRPGAVAGFVAGILIGALVGGIGMFAWLHGPDVGMPRAARPAAVSPSPTSSVAPEASASPTSPELPPRDVGLDTASLREAFDEWIDATRRGDILAQMRFYPQRVPVYYTWRDVSHDAVHAEKQKVFGEATRLVITTGRPSIVVAADGSSAVTRFRKRYVIEGPVQRKGEVVQELRWVRTERGWMIVSERDE